MEKVEAFLDAHIVTIVIGFFGILGAILLFYMYGTPS